MQCTYLMMPEDEVHLLSFTAALLASCIYCCTDLNCCFLTLPVSNGNFSFQIADVLQAKANKRVTLLGFAVTQFRWEDILAARSWHCRG